MLYWNIGAKFFFLLFLFFSFLSFLFLVLLQPLIVYLVQNVVGNRLCPSLDSPIIDPEMMCANTFQLCCQHVGAYGWPKSCMVLWVISLLGFKAKVLRERILCLSCWCTFPGGATSGVSWCYAYPRSLALSSSGTIHQLQSRLWKLFFLFISKNEAGGLHVYNVCWFSGFDQQWRHCWVQLDAGERLCFH